MNPPSDDFESLRKLLAWKRNEQPPPGYFIDFPGRVLARIEAGEPGRSRGWFERLVLSFDPKPVLVCAYSLLVCGALLFGLSFFQMFESEVNSASSPLAESWQTVRALPALATPMAPPFLPENEFAAGAAAISVPTLPMEPASLMFGDGLRVERVSYSVGNR